MRILAADMPPVISESCLTSAHDYLKPRCATAQASSPTEVVNAGTDKQHLGDQASMARLAGRAKNQLGLVLTTSRGKLGGTFEMGNGPR